MPLRIKGDMNIRIPNIGDLLDDDILERAGKRIVADVITNIRDQKKADGGTLKQNAESTKERKRRMALRQMSLKDIGSRLLKPKSWVIKTNLKKRTITIEPSSTQRTARHTYSHTNKMTGRTSTSTVKNTASPKQLLGWVQGMGYVGWFAISKDGLEGIRDLLAKRLLKKLPEEMRKGRRRRRG